MLDFDTQMRPDQLYHRCQANATGLILGTLAVVKERNLAAENWFVQFRRQFTSAWDVLRD